MTSWSWTFGDGGTSTLENPTHTYTGSGSFTVSLTASGPQGSDTETKVNYITLVEPPPVANFSGTPTSGDAPLAVNFLDLSTGNVSSWAWTFGDGGTASVENPAHTYASPGTYTVGLTVTSPGGSDVETKTNYITVTEPPLVADFSGTPTSGVAPLEVDFTDLSSGTIASWSWTFGDGGTSSAQNPSYTYAAAGTYTVALTVAGPLGSDTRTRVDYVTVSNPPPTADFVGAPTSGIAPLTVNFTDLSTGTITSRLWDFGDGTTSTHQNPTHLYPNPGVYTVMLSVSGPSGSNSATKFNYITVNWPAPVAAFTGTPTTGFAPLQVSFTNQSTGNITSRLWIFGDGTNSTDVSPIHVYASPGIYTVRLIVTGPGGTDNEIKPGYITVTEPPPVADFSGTPTSGEAPLQVAFTDTSVGNITNWSWSFGDGGSSTVENPTHTYLAPGQYTVGLTTSGPGGSDTETKVNYIQVQAGINDPSFEEQTAGAAPGAPWTVTFGADHIVNPVTVSEDDGMPAHGTKWCEIAAEGTNNATPPSNPGGVTQPPVGGAGISQVFVYPAGRPVIVFDAAFLRNEEANQPVHNDWMSVDVSDGTTTYNLFHADTFTPATAISARHGWAMTEVASVALDLALAFPSSTSTTLFTITIQVGNGGDAVQPSRGYVDHFRFVQVAAAIPFGCGVNPPGSMTVISGLPRIGTQLRLGIDNPVGTQSIGSIPLLALSIGVFPMFPCGIVVPSLGMDGPGELLILPGANVLKPLLVGQLWTGPGNPAQVVINVPDDAGLVGLSLYAQGMLFDPSGALGVTFGLTDAVQLRFGP
jgi:PKD repeat protein